MSDNLQYMDIEKDEINYNYDEGQIEKIKQNNNRKKRIKTIIIIVRILLAISIIIVVSVIGSTSYFLLKNLETKSFESQYNSIYDVVSIRILNEIDSLTNCGKTLSERYSTEYSTVTGSEYLIDKDGFENEYSKLQSLSIARAISFNPKIDPNSVTTWEAWAETQITNVYNYYDISSKIGGVSIKIYKRDTDGTTKIATTENTACSTSSSHDFYFPVWQIAPIASNTKAIMFDLHSEMNRCKALNDVIDNKKSAMTDIIQLVQDADVTRPSGIFFEPVIISSSLVGTVSIVFSWDSMFEDMIPNDIDSLYLVLSSSTLTYTWLISNGVVKLIGKGDFHETDYNHYKKTVAIDISTMHFDLNIYPSESYTKSFYTSEPQRFTITIILVIACIAFLFLVLDYLQSRNSGKLEREATFKGGIIDELFPSIVQDKLFKRPSSKKKYSSNNCIQCVDRKESNASRLSSYLDISMSSSTIGGLCNAVSEKEVLFHNPDPIAELYENSTVLFADLVGFTAWSENRNPTDVFKLLEGLFASFDKKARIRKVFKVETIGDCYMAVTGVPDKDPHHAEQMADFALDILSIMNKVNDARKLQNEQVELQLRVGIASGPVTAGVVRADRARFQLFGDTVNTAARMEQNSMPSRIQISEATYKLLCNSNYDNILTEREDKINAKGKGQLTTYWLTKKATNGSFAV